MTIRCSRKKNLKLMLLFKVLFIAGAIQIRVLHSQRAIYLAGIIGIGAVRH